MAIEAETLGLAREFPRIGPEAVKGILINPYAAALARVTVWIGEIQWMRRNGFDVGRNPILKPLDTIECRDAILNPDGSEAEWPEADVVIKMTDGNCDAALFHPSDAGSWPVAVIFADALWLRPAFRDMGRRLAAEGYAVLVPNPIYRTRKAPVLSGLFAARERIVPS